MNHLGDITKICGKDAPVVNVIIGGSPCQDLSIAVKKSRTFRRAFRSVYGTNTHYTRNEEN